MSGGTLVASGAECSLLPATCVSVRATASCGKKVADWPDEGSDWRERLRPSFVRSAAANPSPRPSPTAAAFDVAGHMVGEGE